MRGGLEKCCSQCLRGGRQASTAAAVPEGRQAGKAAASTSRGDGRQARSVIKSVSARCVCVLRGVVCAVLPIASSRQWLHRLPLQPQYRQPPWQLGALGPVWR